MIRSLQRRVAQSLRGALGSLGVWTALATAGAVDPTAEGQDVVVVYTRLSPESKSVADYYASKRGVPAEQVIGLAVPPGENITRSDYERLVQEELIRQLRDRNLTEFNAEISPSRPGRPGRVFYRATSSKVRYIALCWGMPYRIQHDAAYDPNHLEEVYRSLPAHLQRDEGSLDGELSLLPIAGRTTAWGPVRNPLYGNTNLTLIQPTNGVFMVTRLDGPTPDIAKRLVDKALTAERDGLNGRAYFDLRSITSGAYATGDHWITNAASVARRHGYETVVDLSPETFPVNQPFPQVALYAGWYAGTFDGPFRLPVVEFMPGAIAYHLHSFSAFWVRSPEHNWVGPLLAKGAAVTLGCIEEPYLELTPNIGIFFERLADQRGSVGEAAVACQAVFSWQTVVVGDPLYRPFKRSFLELESVHEKDGNPALEWDVWRKANDALQRKQSPESVIRDLVAHPLATQSAILAEKIARLHHATGQDRSAIEWGQRSIQAGGSPQQRAQLLRWIAGWQTKPDPKGALATLESFVREFPGHPDILRVLEQELELAQSLRKTADARRIKSAIQALNVPATNSPPVAPTK